MYLGCRVLHNLHPFEPFPNRVWAFERTPAHTTQPQKVDAPRDVTLPALSPLITAERCTSLRCSALLKKNRIAFLCHRETQNSLHSGKNGGCLTQGSASIATQSVKRIAPVDACSDSTGKPTG